MEELRRLPPQLKLAPQLRRAAASKPRDGAGSAIRRRPARQRRSALSLLKDRMPPPPVELPNHSLDPRRPPGRLGPQQRPRNQARRLAGNASEHRGELCRKKIAGAQLSRNPRLG